MDYAHSQKLLQQNNNPQQTREILSNVAQKWIRSSLISLLAQLFANGYNPLLINGIF